MFKKYTNCEEQKLVAVSRKTSSPSARTNCKIAEEALRSHASVSLPRRLQDLCHQSVTDEQSSKQITYAYQYR